MKSRNQSLDVLRGIAIFLVLGVHMNAFPFWKQIGWSGVDLFFVLSGFLISGLLFAEYRATGNIDVRRFILRRGLKIWPSFYVFLFVIGTMLCFARTMWWKSFLWTSAFLLNYVTSPIPSTPHLWSLAVEEHFYVFLPLLLIFLLRWRGSFNLIPRIFAVVGAVCLLLRLLTPLPVHDSFTATHLRIDSLFAGVFLGYLFHLESKRFFRLARWKPLPLVGFALLLPLLFFSHQSFVMQTLGLTSIYAGYGCLLAWVVMKETNPTLKGIAYIGRHSYSIYLWHLPIALMCVGKTPMSFFAAICLSVVFGIVAAKMIEIPVIKIRDRLLPPVTSPIASVQGKENAGEMLVGGLCADPGRRQ